jgi:hypothetical protein
MKSLLAVTLAAVLGFMVGTRFSHPAPVRASGLTTIKWVGVTHADTMVVPGIGTPIAISCVVADGCYVLTQ